MTSGTTPPTSCLSPEGSSSLTSSSSTQTLSHMVGHTPTHTHISGRRMSTMTKKITLMTMMFMLFAVFKVVLVDDDGVVVDVVFVVCAERLRALLMFLEQQSCAESMWRWKVHCKTQKKLKEQARSELAAPHTHTHSQYTLNTHIPYYTHTHTIHASHSSPTNLVLTFTTLKTFMSLRTRCLSRCAVRSGLRRTPGTS